MVLLRQELGGVLRDVRLQKGRTLRQVASKASVALGYLSEVERGQKEASSEILASVADALEVPVSAIMREVSDRLALIDGIVLDDTVLRAELDENLSGIPDTVPEEMVDAYDRKRLVQSR